MSRRSRRRLTLALRLRAWDGWRKSGGASADDDSKQESVIDPKEVYAESVSKNSGTENPTPKSEQ